MDLVAEKEGTRIAVEIETGKSDTIYNIRKDFEAGFDEVVVIVLNQALVNSLKESIMRFCFPSEKTIKVFSASDV